MNLHNFTSFKVKHLTYMKDVSKTKYMPKIGPNVAIASLKASYCVNVEGLGDSPYTKTFLQI
jgi:hypothetical protein